MEVEISAGIFRVTFEERPEPWGRISVGTEPSCSVPALVNTRTVVWLESSHRGTSKRHQRGGGSYEDCGWKPLEGFEQKGDFM